jgi:peptide/nickel transport system ATP-binding protein
MAVLEVKELDVSYMTKKRPPFHAVKKANLTIDEGEIVGLVGESGSGKSTLGTAILRLLDPPGMVTSGQVIFNGKDITHATEDQMRPLRWSEMSTVFQSSMNALNPVVNIGKQFKDVIEAHTDQTNRQIETRTAELLKMVDIDPSFVRFFPHELSGGMKQRVAIALALVLQPKFVLLDEPTTGLDVVVQRSILESLKRIQKQFGFAVLVISHDLGAIMEIADRVAVMYQGELVDDQPAQNLLLQPKHPYSKVLIGSYEDLWKPAAGAHIDLPVIENIEHLEAVQESLTTTPPVVHDLAAAQKHEAAMVIENISRHYTRRRGFTKTQVDAVVDVSFTLRKGYITALVGQSGSGKSTIGRLVTGIEKPDSGAITFGTQRVDQFSRNDLKEYRRHVQLVFQDPYSALNPAHPIAHTLSRPLANFMDVTGKAARKRVADMLEQVGLTPASRGREGVVVGTGYRHRGRADVDARCDDPRGDPRDPEPVGAGQRHRDALHHARPAKCPGSGGRDHGAEQGANRGGWGRGFRDRQSSARLHEIAARLNPESLRGRARRRLTSPMYATGSQEDGNVATYQPTCEAICDESHRA